MSVSLRKRRLSLVLLALAQACGGGGVKVAKRAVLPSSETDGFGIAHADLNKIVGFRFDGSPIDINPCGQFATRAIVQGGDSVFCAGSPFLRQPGSAARDEGSIRGLRGGTMAAYRLRFYPLEAYVAPDARHVAGYTFEMKENEERTVTLSWADLANGGLPEVVYRRRTERKYRYRPLSWAPSGDRFTYVRDGHVYMYTLATGNSAFLTDGDDVSWSPKGDWIAFRGTGHEARIVDPGSGAVKRPMPGRTILHGFAFSPDGQFLLFSELAGSWIDYVSTFFTCQSFTRFAVLNLASGDSTVVYRACMGEQTNGYAWVRVSR